MRPQTGPYTRLASQEEEFLPRAPKSPEFSKTEAGRRIRGLREARGITQVELAKALGIPQSNVSEMERGVRGLTVHQTVKLARALRVSADAILFGSTNGSFTHRPPISLKLLRRLHKLEKLPLARQRAILKLIDALIEQQGPGGR
jgi:transcriptional regulator with XRE-family HTH domain